MKSLLILALLASNSWSLDQKLGVVTIVEGAVTTSKLAQDAVTEAKILTGSVTTAKVAAGAITTSKLAADPLTVDGVNGRIGIRLSAPLASLSVSGVSGSGPTATDKGIAQFQSAADAIALEVGTYSGSPFTAYIQGHDPRSGQNSTYPLSLNPIGGNVGIGTTNPGAQFEVLAATFSVASSGIVSIPSQPAVRVRSSQNRALAFNTFQQVFFDTVEINHNGMFVITSSGIVTIPVGGGGGYMVTCALKINTTAGAGYSMASISKNGAGNRNIEQAIANVAGTEYNPIANGLMDLAAGDTLRCEAYQNVDAGGSTLVNTNAGYSFSAVKVY